MSIVNLNSENFDKEVLQSEMPVLIDFWANWCGPCRMMHPVVEEIANSMNETIKVCKVNIDEATELAERYNVMTIPTFLVIKGGKEAGRTIGVQPKGDILKLI